MTNYHGSNEQLTEIKASGIFGGLFAGSASTARSHGDVVYEIISPRPLSDYELNYEVEGAWDAALKIAKGREEVAEAIMSVECNSLDDCEPEDAGEQGWEFQRLRGILASMLGYTSIEMRDEHGTTWLCLPGCSISQAAME